MKCTVLFVLRNTSIYECLCNDGYIGDGFVCTLEPNCRNDPGLCPSNSQCYQTGREYRCVCDVGECLALSFATALLQFEWYEWAIIQRNLFVGFIEQDRDCVPLPAFESGFLLLGQGMAIVRVPLDGRPAYPVTTSSVCQIEFCFNLKNWNVLLTFVSHFQMIVGVDKDCSRGRIYWSDIVARQILSANYNGTDKQVLIKDGNQIGMTLSLSASQTQNT